jgi:ubiquinone/menaquinone biosynthesis C-methylase UbiE
MHVYTAEDRISKARKIESILVDFFGYALEDKRILDVGCGSGHIAEYLAERNTVFGTDVVDQVSEECHDFFSFKMVDAEILPFPDDEFDVVISNHVIAYIANQRMHFSEIYRVLKNGGIAYFATPNRLFPIEPHYRIPLINYLPNQMCLNFLKWRGKKEKDIYFPRYWRMKKITRKKGV